MLPYRDVLEPHFFQDSLLLQRQRVQFCQ
jgi:hypothetical protein